MSTPNERSDPQQPGQQSPPPGYDSAPDPRTPQAPPPGYQPPYQQQGSYPPPGYQQPYQQAPYPQQGGQPRSGNFQLPQDRPRSLRDVMPAGGFSGMFKVNGLPQMVKVSYILWLVTGGLGLLFSLISVVTSLALLASRFSSGFAVRSVVVSILTVVLMAAVVLCAMKLKDGMQWARVALTAIVAVTFILAFMGGGGVGLMGVAAAVFMWLPESTAWLKSRATSAGY